MNDLGHFFYWPKVFLSELVLFIRRHTKYLQYPLPSLDRPRQSQRHNSPYLARPLGESQSRYLPCVYCRAHFTDFTYFPLVNRESLHTWQDLARWCHISITSFRLQKTGFWARFSMFGQIANMKTTGRPKVNTDCGNRFWTTFVM